ncbi:MAG TPA: hypothetical protein VGF48_13915 [Thermoanaerobaculia bacterium]|jgi:hypothetical protein
MRRLFALLVLLFAAVHPVVHQHPSALPGVVALDAGSATQDCPCTHAVAVNDAPPQLTALLLPTADHHALPATPFVASAYAGDLPARAPPSVA